MRIAVTGARGFVGRALVQVVREQGHEAVAVSRSSVCDAGVTTVTGLDDLRGLTAAFAGADVVVHLAARVHVLRDRAHDPLTAFRTVNVEGTRSVLAAAEAAGVGRVAYASTVKVHGESTVSPFTEASPIAPRDAYARSKAEAEEVVHRWRGDHGWVVVRPPLVYGPGVGANFARLVHLARRSLSLPLPLGGIRNRRSLAFVANLADALFTVATRSEARNATYLVSDGVDFSTTELVQHLARGLGGEARLLPCPEKVVRQLAAIVGRRDEAARLLDSLVVDAGQIGRDLGWQPPHQPVPALASTARAVIAQQA
jgi:nucleoside-diphosphate-sugar epimerase